MVEYRQVARCELHASGRDLSAPCVVPVLANSGSHHVENAANSNPFSGLDEGIPNLEPLSKAYDYLIREGFKEEAKALEVRITNRSWNGARLLESGCLVPSQAGCERCGADLDFVHSDYVCPANRSIDHWSIREMQSHATQADEQPHYICLWHRGINPASNISESPGWIDEEMCKPEVFGQFEESLQVNRSAGTDGAGYESNTFWARRVTSGVAVVTPHDNTQVAFLNSRVQGRQAGPRAELWAVLHAMNWMAADTVYTLLH